MFLSRREKDVRHRMRTFLRVLLVREALKHLIETRLLPWVPSHTSAMAPRSIGSSPTLPISPDTMYEDGRVAWRLQMACNLRRHAGATLSVVGTTPRACGAYLVTDEG